MQEVSGDLLEKGTTRLVPARLLWDGRGFVIYANGANEIFTPDKVTLSDHVKGVPARLTLPRGMVFTTQDHDGLEGMLRAAGLTRPGGNLASWEGWKSRLVFILLALALCTFALFQWGMPTLASAAASLFPPQIEARMGESAFETLDDRLFKRSRISVERQSEILNAFEELKAASGLPGDIPLYFRAAPIGPNALAFPGGPIVLTDDMVNLADDEGVVGVLAHELGHVAERHTLQRLMLATGTALFIAGAVGDFGEVIEEAAAVPALLLDSAYSRGYESEADDFAKQLMERTGRDPAALARVFELLQAQCGEDCPQSWLATHPPLAERAEKLR